MKRKYGIPYQGSKNKILNQVCKLFPPAKNFYDLFGGGFSVTHFMLENRKEDFQKFHFNEIRQGVCELIKDAIEGKYSYENFRPEFIDRDRFFREMDENFYIKCVWSFGNAGRTYLFGKDIEEEKKSLHNAIVFNRFDDLAKKIINLDKFTEKMSIKDRRLFVRHKVSRKINIDGNEKLQRLERLQQLQQLEQLERLQQLERLERLQQLEFYNLDYRKIKIKKDSIVYYDIPYRGTAGYDEKKFNHKEFYDWADSRMMPVFISEYSLPDKRFTQIASFPKISLISSKSRKLLSENVYINRSAYKKYFEYRKNLRIFNATNKRK